MRKVDIKKIQRFKSNTSKLYLAIISKGTDSEERYIGHIVRSKVSDWDMKVVEDLNEPINPFGIVILKACDDVYLLNEYERRLVLV